MYFPLGDMVGLIFSMSYGKSMPDKIWLPLSASTQHAKMWESHPWMTALTACRSRAKARHDGAVCRSILYQIYGTVNLHCRPQIRPVSGEPCWRRQSIFGSLPSFEQVHLVG